MATPQDVAALAHAMREIAIEMKRLRYRAAQVLAHNSAKSIDWNQLASELPDAVDANGNILNQRFTPTQMSNAIGSVDAFATTLWGTHGGNLELLADPLS